jgi:hypothetical protein
MKVCNTDFNYLTSEAYGAEEGMYRSIHDPNILWSDYTSDISSAGVTTLCKESDEEKVTGNMFYNNSLLSPAITYN